MACIAALRAATPANVSLTLGTHLEAPSDLRVENIQVLNQLPLPDGRVLIEASASVRNIDEGVWSGVSIIANGLEVIGWIYPPTRYAGVLEANSALASSNSFYTLVHSNDLAAARAELLAGTPFHIYATDVAGNRVQDPAGVELENTRILGEIAVSGSNVLMVFAADVRNTSSNVWFDVAAELDAALTIVPHTVPAPASTFPETLGAFATASNMPPLYFAVASNNVAIAVSNVLSGAALTHSGTELWCFKGPPKGIDAATEDAWVPPAETLLGVTTLVFDQATPYLLSLLPGDIMLEDPGVNRLTPPQKPLHPLDNPPKVLADYVPFEVSSVTMVGPNVHVTGHVRLLLDVTKSATFFQDSKINAYDGPVRDPYDPEVENTYTKAEQAAREVAAAVIAEVDPRDGRLADLRGMTAIPWHFNEFPIADKIKLSGELLLRSSGVKLQVRIRNFRLQHAIVHIDAGVVMNLLIECESGANVTNDTGSDGTPLFELPLPAVSLNIAGVPVTIQPVAYFNAGVEANVPRRLALPLQSAFIVGMEMGYDPGRPGANANGFFYEPIKEFIPLRVSDAEAFDTLAAEVGVWAELGIGIEGSIAEIVNGGPKLALRLGSDFRLAPLEDPWWSLDASLDVIGRFSIDILGMTLVDASASLDHNSLFHRDAGGPLIPVAASLHAKSSGNGAHDLTPTIGKDVRWGLAFSISNAYSTAYDKGFVIPLAGGGYFVGGGAAVPSFLGVVSATGDIEWMQTFPHGAKPVDAEQLADGSVMVIGSAGLDWWLAKYDTNGARQWVKSHRIYAELRDLAVRTAGNGDPEYFLAGFHSRVVVTDSDPVVVKLDKDGNLVWEKDYTLPGDHEVYSIRTLRDGNLLMTGITDWSVGTDLFIGRRGNGLVMKISPDGNVIWATALAARYGMLLRDSAEAPDGTLYAVGSHGDLIWNFYPDILVAKLSADGALLNHVLIGEDPDWPDELIDGGDTPNDTAAQCLWTENGLVVVGTTGVGDTATGFAMAVTDELGVQWFSVFDGPAATALADVAATESGIATLGWAQSIWAGKFTGRYPAWLLSLPWEGMMRFHANTGARSLYLQPRVFRSDVNLDFIGRYTDSYGRQQFLSTDSVSFEVTNVAPPLGATIQPGVFQAFEFVRLERLDPSLVDTYQEWTAYNQISGPNSLPAGDLDGDGVANLWEFFTGRDPLVSETNTPRGLSIRYDPAGAVAEIQFLQSQAASGEPFSLQSTTDFVTWAPVNNATTERSVAAQGLWQWRYFVPVGATNDAFFRLQLP